MWLPGLDFFTRGFPIFEGFGVREFCLAKSRIVIVGWRHIPTSQWDLPHWVCLPWQSSNLTYVVQNCTETIHNFWQQSSLGMQLVILWKASTNGINHLLGNFLVAPLDLPYFEAILFIWPKPAACLIHRKSSSFYCQCSPCSSITKGIF